MELVDIWRKSKFKVILQKKFKHKNKMDIKEFIAKFAEQFEETDPSIFQANTEFKELDEWSSLTALSLIAMIDEEFDVQLKGDDIRNSKTVQDIFNIVESKI